MKRLKSEWLLVITVLPLLLIPAIQSGLSVAASVTSDKVLYFDEPAQYSGYNDYVNCTFNLNTSADLSFTGYANFTNCTFRLNKTASIRFLNGTFNLINTTLEGINGMPTISFVNASATTQGLNLRNTTLLHTGGTVNYNGTFSNCTLNTINTDVIFNQTELYNCTIRLEDSTLGIITNLTGNSTQVSAVNTTINGGPGALLYQGIHIHIYSTFKIEAVSDAINYTTSPTYSIMGPNETINVTGSTVTLETVEMDGSASAIDYKEYVLRAFAPGLKPAYLHINYSSPQVIKPFLKAARVNFTLLSDRMPFTGEDFNVTVRMKSTGYWYNGTVYLNGILRQLSVPENGSQDIVYHLTAPSHVGYMNLTPIFSSWPLASEPKGSTLSVYVLSQPEITGIISVGQALVSEAVTFTIVGHYTDSAAFMMDFGDGNVTDWTNTWVFTHNYTHKGSYIPRAKVGVPGRIESDWFAGSTLNITQPEQPPPALQIHVEYGSESYNVKEGEFAEVECPSHTNITITPSNRTASILLDGTVMHWNGSLIINFEKAGSHVLTVSDNIVIYINITNTAPILDAHVDVHGKNASFSATVIDRDVEGEIVYWDVSSNGSEFSFVGYNFTHEFEPGEYTYTASARDASGGISNIVSGYFSIIPSSPNPSVNLLVPGNATFGPFSGTNNTLEINCTGELNIVMYASFKGTNITWLVNGIPIGYGQLVILGIDNSTSVMNISVIARNYNLTGFVNISMKFLRNNTNINSSVSNTNTEKNETNKNGGSGWFWLVVVVAVVLAVIVLVAVLMATKIIPIPGRIAYMLKSRSWSDIDARNFNKIDLVILKKGEKDMEKFELLEAQSVKDGGPIKVYAGRIFQSPNGEVWYLSKEVRGDDVDEPLNFLRENIDKKLRKGFEVYVKGYGRILTVHAKKIMSGANET